MIVWNMTLGPAWTTEANLQTLNLAWRNSLKAFFFMFRRRLSSSNYSVVVCCKLSLLTRFCEFWHVTVLNCQAQVRIGPIMRSIKTHLSEMLTYILVTLLDIRQAFVHQFPDVLNKWSRWWVGCCNLNDLCMVNRTQKRDPTIQTSAKFGIFAELSLLGCTKSLFNLATLLNF